MNYSFVKLVKSTEFVNEIYKITSKAIQITCAWISGCEFFESFSDDKIAQDCTMVLRKFIDKYIPLPKQIFD